MEENAEMKSWKNKTLVIIPLLALLLMVTNASAIGVSPGTISFDKMVRGGYAEKILTISTAGDEDLTLKIEASGEIKEWITFEPSDAHVILPKKSAKQLLVKINIPNTARNGLYNGEVIISTLYLGAETGNVSGARFMPGIIVRVQLNLTGEEVVAYDITSISVKDTEQNYPAEFNLRIENIGNVVVTPGIHVTILNSDKEEIGKTLDYAQTSILPTTSKQITIKMPTKGMDIGAYYARISSDRGEEQTLFFQILAQGTLALKGSLEQILLNKIWVKPGETVKVDATFSNDGELSIDSAKLKGEAYIIDPTYGTKELAGVFEGDSISVPVGEKVTLNAYFTPQKSGIYTIQGMAIYSGKRTDVKSTILNVLETSSSGYGVYYFLIGSIIVIAVVFYLTRMSDYTGAKRYRRYPSYAPPVEKPTTPTEIEKKPVLTPEVMYKKLKDELRGIKKDSIVIVSVESQQHSETISSVLTVLINEKDMGCIYVSVSKPYEQIIKAMKTAKVKTDKIFFIDCISQMAGRTPEKAENTTFIENPSSLEEVSLYIDKLLASVPQTKFIMVDSLSSLLIYNTESSVKELTHRIINKARNEKVGGVILSIKQTEGETLTKTLVPMCDKEIVL